MYAHLYGNAKRVGAVQRRTCEFVTSLSRWAIVQRLGNQVRILSVERAYGKQVHVDADVR